MNLTTKFNKYVNCEMDECEEIARLEDSSGALICHDCRDEMESEQGYCSVVGWIDYDDDEIEKGIRMFMYWFFEKAMEEASKVLGADHAYFGEEGIEEVERQLNLMGYTLEEIRS